MHRVGYGAMQLPGPGVMGPPRDRTAALSVLRRARELGVDHIDTASYYGPDVANQLIHDALHPYSPELRLVSKVGAWRDERGGWLPALGPAEIRAAVVADLRVLATERLTMVNQRLTEEVDARAFQAALDTLVELRDEGLIELIGLSNVRLERLDTAQATTPIASVQNRYGVLDRENEDVLAACGERGLAFVPFFPLGAAFGAAPRPADDPTVQRVATELGATPANVALAWLLQHGEHLLLIPGTSSVAHLEENMTAADLQLRPQDIAALDALA